MNRDLIYDYTRETIKIIESFKLLDLYDFF